MTSLPRLAFCCYCSVRCSLVSPCLEGWLGDGAWEGCVPEGRVWAMGTPPGTMPSNAPGRPPGATPTTPGGYLVTDRARRWCQGTMCAWVSTCLLPLSLSSEDQVSPNLMTSSSKIKWRILLAWCSDSMANSSSLLCNQCPLVSHLTRGEDLIFTQPITIAHYISIMTVHCTVSPNLLPLSVLTGLSL